MASEGRQMETKSQTTGQSDHRTTAWSNSMKPSHAVWGHPRQTGHAREVCILNATFSQHHLLGFEIAQVEFDQLH